MFIFPKNDIFIKSDEIILKTILSNLINNAIKFTNEGGVTISLEESHDNSVKYLNKRYRYRHF